MVMGDASHSSAHASSWDRKARISVCGDHGP